MIKYKRNMNIVESNDFMIQNTLQQNNRSIFMYMNTNYFVKKGEYVGTWIFEILRKIWVVDEIFRWKVLGAKKIEL